MKDKNLFKSRHFESGVILLCVRWYCRYGLSYRNLTEMMVDLGLNVSHTTLYRWVQRYAPEIDKRCRVHLRKGQIRDVDEGDLVAQNKFVAERFGIAA